MHTRHHEDRGAARAKVVCLISANPLALGELERLVAPTRGVRVKRSWLDLSSCADAHEVRVPRASVYVLDSWSTNTATDAVVSAVHRRRPNSKVIVLTGRISEAGVFAFLQLGVKGLVAQKHLSDHLPRAVLAVARGGLWIPRAVLSKFVAHTLGASGPHGRGRPPHARISHRERQVLNCVLKSHSNKEISAELHISESTVKFHLSRLFEKFGVRRRADLILHTVQQPGSLVH